MAKEKLILKEEERVKEVLERIQHFSRTENHYILMAVDQDWFIVLQALQDKGYARVNPQRPPLKEFEEWLRDSKVPQYIAHCNVFQMSKVSRKFSGVRYPWQGVNWDPDMVKRWRTLYEALSRLFNEEVAEPA